MSVVEEGTAQPTWEWPGDSPSPDPAVETQPSAPTEQVEQTAEAQPETPAEDPWDTILTPDDEELSPSLRKVPIRKYLEETKRALVREKTAGRDKNRAIEALSEMQNVVARSLEREAQMQKRFEQLSNGKPATPAPVVNPYRERGYNPATDLIDRPEELFNVIPEISRAQAELIAAQQAGESKKTIEQLSQRVDDLRIEIVSKEIESTYDKARPESVPAGRWKACRDAMAMLIKQEGWRANDPRSWQEAYPVAEKFLRTQFGELFSTPGASTTPPPQNVIPAAPVGGAKSGGGGNRTGAHPGAALLAKMSATEKQRMKVHLDTWNRGAADDAERKPMTMEDLAVVLYENSDGGF